MDTRQHQIIHQNLHYTILQLSFPGMVSSVLQTLFQLIDAYWVGKLGAAALAAIGGCSFILWAIFSLTALSVNGISALVAQNIGAGKNERARLTAGQGILMSTIISLILLILTLWLQNYLYILMGFSAEVLPLASAYMTIVLFGLPFVFWFTSLESVFRGMGNTRTPMYILAMALALNAILDPVLILGWLGLPALGIKGAALATALAQLLASALCWFFLKRYNFLPLLYKKGRALLDKFTLQRILSIGAPIAFGGFFFSLIYVLLTNIISRFGTEAIAAIGVGHRIEGVAWFACVGFSVAVSTLVGQFLGAGQVKEAKRAVRWVSLYGVGTLFLASLIFYFWPQWLMHIFTSDPVVQQIGSEYLRIIALFEIFLALEVIMEGAFSGAGYTAPVMLVTVPITALRIPLAWYLAISLNMGVSGIWWAIASTTFLKGSLNTVLFLSGLWKKKLHLVPQK